MAIGGFLGSDPTITVSQFATLVDKGELRYVLTSGGFGGGGGARGGFGGFTGRTGGQTPAGAIGSGAFPGQFAPAPASNNTASTSTAKGATVVMAAVEKSCKAVTNTTLPAQYQGAIYDCSGAGSALRAAS